MGSLLLAAGFASHVIDKTVLFFMGNVPIYETKLKFLGQDLFWVLGFLWEQLLSIL